MCNYNNQHHIIILIFLHRSFSKAILPLYFFIHTILGLISDVFLSYMGCGNIIGYSLTPVYNFEAILPSESVDNSEFVEDKEQLRPERLNYSIFLQTHLLELVPITASLIQDPSATTTTTNMKQMTLRLPLSGHLDRGSDISPACYSPHSSDGSGAHTTPGKVSSRLSSSSSGHELGLGKGGLPQFILSEGQERRILMENYQDHCSKLTDHLFVSGESVTHFYHYNILTS